MTNKSLDKLPPTTILLRDRDEPVKFSIQLGVLPEKGVAIYYSEEGTKEVFIDIYYYLRDLFDFYRKRIDIEDDINVKVRICKNFCDVLIGYKNDILDNIIEKDKFVTVIKSYMEDMTYYRNRFEEEKILSKPTDKYFTHLFTTCQQKELYDGLIKREFLSIETDYDYFCYVFGGNPIPKEKEPFKPLQWTKNVQDLKMLIDTILPNEKNKWKKTVLCFLVQNAEINYNSIRNLNPSFKDNPKSEIYFQELKLSINQKIE